MMKLEPMAGPKALVSCSGITTHYTLESGDKALDGSKNLNNSIFLSCALNLEMVQPFLSGCVHQKWMKGIIKRLLKTSGS